MEVFWTDKFKSKGSKAKDYGGTTFASLLGNNVVTEERLLGLGLNPLVPTEGHMTEIAFLNIRKSPLISCARCRAFDPQGDNGPNQSSRDVKNCLAGSTEHKYTLISLRNMTHRREAVISVNTYSRK